MIIDRINSWVLKRLPSRKSSFDLSLGDVGLQVKSNQGIQYIAWTDINKIVATRSDQLIGNTILLIIGLNDGSALTVPEDSLIWKDLTLLLLKYLTGAKSYQEWALPAVFSNESPHIVVFQR